MPTDTEQITTIKTRTLALLADLSENPKPSYMIDGQSIQWAAYERMLLAKVEWCDARLPAQDIVEVHSTGYS